jgi:Raf kinase inhibitor-like YbhB/YbcL family protein
MTRLRWALIGMCVLLIAACGNDGRTLREPDPGATAPPVPRSSTTTSSQVVGPAGSASTTGFELTSSAFAPGAPIPVMYTCDGDNVSPPLAWESVPAGTVELALTDVDPDANNFVHWVMAGIDPTVQAIDAGSVPDGVVQAKNTAGSVGWTGSCPPKGAPHHYVFTLYALTTPSGLSDGVDGRSAISTLQQQKSPTATLVGTYQRAG